MARNIWAFFGIRSGLALHAGGDEALLLNGSGHVAEGAADACFLTGTGAELIPVSSVDGRSLHECPGNIFELLNKKLHTLVKRGC